MAKIKMVGQALVLTSGVKAATIAQLAKFKPDALQLKEGEKKETVYGMNVGSSASFTKFGAIFNATTADGFAQLTLSAPVIEDAAKKEAYIKDNYGYALLNLNKLEAQINTIADDTAEEFAAMSESIEVE
jgi:hypothetical protein